MYKTLIAVPGNYQQQIVRLKRAGFQVYQKPISLSIAEEAFVQEVLDYHCVIMGGGPWTEKVISKLKENGKLKMIVKFGVGVDNIDLSAATKHGIAVANAPGSNSRAVAEHALALMLALTRRIISFDQNVRRGSWKDSHSDSLIGKTVGLLGFGNIAQKLAEFLRSLPVEVIAYDLYKNEERAEELGVRYVELEELISTSDLISVHVPLTDSTRGMVNRDFFQKMKPTAYLVNTSRGAVVCEKDLIEALKNGLIRGAALDTFEEEPLNPNSELTKLSNVVLTPHSASNTDEAYLSIMDCCVENVIAFFVRKELRNVLNPDFRG